MKPMLKKTFRRTVLALMLSFAASTYGQEKPAAATGHQPEADPGNGDLVYFKGEDIPGLDELRDENLRRATAKALLDELADAPDRALTEEEAALLEPFMEEIIASAQTAQAKRPDKKKKNVKEITHPAIKRGRALGLEKAYPEEFKEAEVNIASKSPTERAAGFKVMEKLSHLILRDPDKELKAEKGAYVEFGFDMFVEWKQETALERLFEEEYGFKPGERPPLP